MGDIAIKPCRSDLRTILELCQSSINASAIGTTISFDRDLPEAQTKAELISRSCNKTTIVSPMRHKIESSIASTRSVNSDINQGTTPTESDTSFGCKSNSTDKTTDFIITECEAKSAHSEQYQKLDYSLVASDGFEVRGAGAWAGLAFRHTDRDGLAAELESLALQSTKDDQSLTNSVDFPRIHIQLGFSPANFDSTDTDHRPSVSATTLI